MIRSILDPNDAAITFKTVETAAVEKMAPLAEPLAITDDDEQAALRKQFLEGYYAKPVPLTVAEAAAV